MIYYTRKHGSSWTSRKRRLDFDEIRNVAGQGGAPYFALFDPATQRYHIFQPETLAEVRRLQSEAAILAYNVQEREG